MAQITAPHDLHHRDPREADESRREHLRSTLPAALAVVLLFGVLVVGAFVLRDLLDFGMWFVSEAT